MACPRPCRPKRAGRGLDYLDATCPLVSKVHRQAQRLIEAGRHIIFIGHAGHPEVIGTFGQVPPGSMTLVETEEDVPLLEVADPDNLAFLTQTTLSVDDTAAIVAALQPALSPRSRRRAARTSATPRPIARRRSRRSCRGSRRCW
jgi:4-hydroxy-3-methylbut-2-enyl diphosphate reductase